MSKQTALQELFTAHYNRESLESFNDWLCDNKDRLLQMEREQIEEAFDKGYDDHEYNNDLPKYGADPDVYYTQTYGE